MVRPVRSWRFRSTPAYRSDSGARYRTSRRASVSNAVRVVEVLPARTLLSDGLKGFNGLCASAQIVPSSIESAGTPVIFSTSSASGASGGAASASSSEFVEVVALGPRSKDACSAGSNHGRECVVQPWESLLMQKTASQAAALRVEGRRTAFRVGRDLTRALPCCAWDHSLATLRENSLTSKLEALRHTIDSDGIETQKHARTPTI